MQQGRHVVVVGATGMVGGHVLELALAREDVAHVTAIGRRQTGRRHPKLREVVHEDFGNCEALASVLVGQDVALFCLGAYTGAVSNAELKRITVDFVSEFARVVHRASPAVAFGLLSGQGADATEKSWVAYARYKGMAENALVAEGFDRLHLFRPGYIHAVVPRREPSVMYRLFRFVYPLVRRVTPHVGIESQSLARVMVEVGLDGELAGQVLENRELRGLAAR